jgi:hypothetical protein
MCYTISDLFKAMHYCNKCVKWENFEDEQEKKRFYKMKRDLVYYLIRNHKELNITIDDCHIDLQPSKITNGNVRLYAFCLTYGDSIFKVHQKEYSKLTQLFDLLNINFSEIGTYELKMDDTLSFTMEEFANAMVIISEFYNKWKLDSLIYNLNDPNAHVEDVYESFVFFFPDFKFKLEMKGSTMGKHTIVNVIHRRTGRSYRLPMNALKAHGEKYLPCWRKEHHNFKHCIN